MFDCHAPFKDWRKHMAVVPKGFLRYQILKLLNEKPLSGSEIMNEIERRTNGFWKPSPGSVYPLLSWLQDKGYIKEAESEEAGVKRYTLTDEGRKFFEEQRMLRDELMKRGRIFVPPFFGDLWFRISSKDAIKIRMTLSRLIKAFLDLGVTLEEKFSEQALNEAIKVLDEAAVRIEEIKEKILSGGK
ncbi:MAG: PadR family transcriptional regulator [Candidatus Methanomethylicia archaeon]